MQSDWNPALIQRSPSWGRGYMQQYLNEFDFRYNHRKTNDSERTLQVLRATEGKRLTLRQPKSASA
jgi:hypothetical protein